MKLNISPKAATSGAALLVSLFICTLFAIGIAGYLSLSEQQYKLSSRSQEWNVSMAVVEAGIEEGLQHLNTNPTNLNSCGWTYTSNNCYTLSRTLAPNASYVVTIDNSDPWSPQVFARASSSQQTLAKTFSHGPTLATIGLGATPAGAPTRAVRVLCERASLYRASVVAKRTIDLKGNGVLTDSYDSSVPSKSTNGRYDPTKYAGDMGDVASNGGIMDSVSVQNANIYGRLHVGPNTPIAIGSQGAVGTHEWQATHSGFQEGFVRRDANFTFPDTKLPSINGVLQPSAQTVVTPVFDYTSTNALWSMTYPNPPPPGGVITNLAYKSSLQYPFPAPEWVTTNLVTITTNVPPPFGIKPVTTNIYTQSLTTSGPPGTGIEYLGGVTTNYGKNKKIASYTYNKITGRDYTFSTLSYTYPCYTYHWSSVETIIHYETNYYDNVVDGTQWSPGLSGTTLIKSPNSVLILPNGLTGSENFKLADGASLTIYAGGSSVTISGNQYLNPSGFAGNFIVLCDPSVKSFTLNGNGQFTGVLVAPEADLKMNGGGNSDQDFCGALMCNNLRLNGHFKFHYDEALGKGPANGRYLIKSWDEVK